ncbi:HEAT repeat domain-containing protein [Sorangium sp. So ce1182]|uniref:HEAT repeat domain-containing protein n=1 Tax=Sorangium sp. So ce1182 TaxID=3133334 RepID=UPI003F5F021F
MKTKRIAIALGTVIVIATAGFAWRWGVHAAQSGAVLELSCIRGEAQVYSLSYRSQGKLLDPALGMPVPDAGEPRSVDVIVDGRWKETCVRQAESMHVVAVAFEHADGSFVTSEVGRSAARPLVSGTTFVEVGKDGAVRGVHFDPEMSDIGRNIIRDIVSLRSTRLENARLNATWQTSEKDLNGTYKATYTLERADDKLASVRKARTSYGVHSTALRGEKRPTVRITGANDAVFDVDVRGHKFTNVMVKLSIEIVVGKKVVGKTKSDLTLKWIEAASADDVASLEVAEAKVAGRTADLAGADVDARIDERVQRDELGADTWDTLADRIAHPDVDPAKTSLKLRALFRLHPEDCDKARDALVAGRSARDRWFLLLSQALASAGSSQAQKALTQAMARTTDRQDHQEVIVAELGQIAAPTLETEAFVRDAAARHVDGDVRDMAKLGLGTMARSLRDLDPARSDALTQEAVGRWTEAKDDRERVVALGVLGNAGSEEGLNPVREALQSDNAAVRSAAAMALRFVEGSDAEQTLNDVLEKDRSPDVRSAAVQALGFRSLSDVSEQQIEGLIRREPSEAVRLNALSVLGNQADRYPTAVQVIESMSKADPSTSVRNAAALLLVRLQASGM